MPFCEVCQIECEVSLKYHQRITHQGNKNIKLKDGLILQCSRKEDGMFHCPLKQDYRHGDPNQFAVGLLQYVKTFAFIGVYGFILKNVTCQCRIPNEQMYSKAQRSHSQTITKNQAVICLQCQQPILPQDIPTHIQGHLKYIVIPSGLTNTLIDQFQLSNTYNYPSKVCNPIYGIPLIENPVYFCLYCNMGYNKESSLHTHMSQRCKKSKVRGTKTHRGHGQLIPGQAWRIIKVLTINLLKKTDNSANFIKRFTDSVSVARNFSQLPIFAPEDNMNLKLFFAQDGWLGHIKGFTPADLAEARRTHKAADINGNLSEHLLTATIQDNINFGLWEAIGSVFPTATNSLHSFRTIQPASVEKYLLPWMSAYWYPEIDSSQRKALGALWDALYDNQTVEDVDDLYHWACLALLTHQKHQYPTSQKASNFFLPVICFLVVHCIHKNLAMLNSSLIMNIIAPIIVQPIVVCLYGCLGNRGVVPGQSHQAFGLINEQYTTYIETLREKLFFNKPIPNDLFPKFEIKKLEDNFCHVYGSWLLSNKVQRERFVYDNGNGLVWKPDMCMELLESFQLCKLELAPGLVMSVGVSACGTEFGCLMGSVTERHLGENYKIQWWRGLTYGLLSKASQQALVKISKEFYSDHVNMRTTKTGLNLYSGNTGNLSSKDSDKAAVCVNVGLAWQKMVDIGQEKPLRSSILEDITTPTHGLTSAVNIDGIARQVITAVESQIDMTIRNTIKEAMADMALMFFPKLPITLGLSNLQMVSDVDVHPSCKMNLRIFLKDKMLGSAVQSRVSCWNT
ncbi:hypothetical protein B0H34DRAFT_837404 [Crassisporium funariophilum]|nr:hypothetical protein B0H34DRAFT_837404 [Crassisporium funariophilum]